MRLLILPLLLALAAPPARSQAPAADGWLGRRVITQYGAVLRSGNDVVDDEDRSKNIAITGRDKSSFRIYKVEEVNGPWLLLVPEKGGVKGYVQAAEVIPFDQAIDYFTNQIRSNPSSSAYYGRRAQIWREKGELDIAIADLNEAIRLDPSSDVAYNNRGNAWHDKKEYDKAIADYAEAIRLDPKNPDWLNGLAWFRATCPDAKYRDGKAAVEDATRACELSGWKDVNSIDTLAAAYAELGDFAKAVEFQERAIKDNKNADVAKEFSARIELYKARNPYRDTPAPG